MKVVEEAELVYVPSENSNQLVEIGASWPRAEL